MNINLKIFLVIVCLFFIVYIYLKVLNKKLDHKSALLLIPMLLILMILCIFDNILNPIKEFLGFEVTSNMIFFLGFIFVSILLLNVSIKLNKQNEKIIKLTQEIAILKKDSKHEKDNK